MKKLLRRLNIKADIVGEETNGIMTKYFLQLQAGGKISTIERYAREIALYLKAYSVPIVRPITERGLVSLEFVIQPINNVSFFDILSELSLSSATIPIILGQTYTGEKLVADLYSMPHLLVAGTTGSGKSSMLHSIICSTLFQPNVKLILIDPKQVEFSHYEGVKNLLRPIIIDHDTAYKTLDWCIDEMERRFDLLRRAKVNNITEYRKKLPFIVVVIDEFADLITTNKKQFQAKISNLAQKSRAVGIHLVIATQRPDTSIINGVIKSNFSVRIALSVPSKIDSRVILDENGAEVLKGKGDAIINGVGYDLLRFKGAWISSRDIQYLVENNQKSWWQKTKEWMISIR